MIRDPRDGGFVGGGCLTARRSAAPETGGRCGLVRGRGGAAQLGFGGLSSLAFAGGRLYATATRQSAVSSFAIPGG